MIVEKSLTSAQRDDLRVIAGMMIPESDEYNVPGADDAAIQGDIIATLGRDTKMVAAALDHIARLAGKPLAQLDTIPRPLCWALLAISAVIFLIQIWNYVVS